MSAALDEIGKKYGRWTVLSREKNNKKGNVCWLCRCDCGNKRIIPGIRLRSGLSKSCGCLQREKASQSSLKNIVGHRFGKLVVLERDSEPRNSKRVFWRCVCDCGNETVVSGTNLRTGNTKSCGCLHKEKTSLAFGVASFHALVTRYKDDAKKRGYEWNLTDEQVELLTQQDCCYCGKPPSSLFHRNSHNGDYIYNGIDRQDPLMGYVSENVVPCCKVCNYAKHTMQLSEFKDWVKLVYDRMFSS